ncbi:hypothetical protein ACFLRI_02705 [Bacteroidota bacterium]
MKNPLLILVFILSVFSISAQNAAIQSNKFKFGINGGVIWEVDDVRWQSGSGWGVTLERVLNPKETAFFHISLRARYLKGESMGIDWQADSGIKNNLVLSGQYEPELDYANTLGYVYQNHFTELKEWSLEGIIHMNKLRTSTNILFYVFGGLGFTSYFCYTDQLDKTNTAYNYTTITSTDRKNVLLELKDLRDNTFETASFGRDGHEVVFTPSLGAGLGYQLTNNFSIGIEHKISYPYTDLFDGRAWNQLNMSTGDNDIYHYSQIGFMFFFGGEKDKKVKSKTGPVVSEKNKIPSIIINLPKSDPHYADPCEAIITATILEIEGKENIRVYKNGSPLNTSEYDYNPENKSLYIRQQLDGDSRFRIFAYNSFGNDAKELEIKCQGPSEKPSVKIITPSQNNTSVADCQVLMVATTKNVNSKSNIEVTLNGSALSIADYTFSNLSQEISINRKISGNSTFVIRVRNDFGTATDQLTVTCGQGNAIPKVSIINQNTTPTIGIECKAYIQARITNMESKFGITVRLNGNKISTTEFDFNPRTNILVVNKNFSGDVKFSITAQNEYGYDLQEISFYCRKKEEQIKLPQVKITSPPTDPFKTEEYFVDITATVLNVSNSRNIRVTENGQTLATSFYSYNPNTKLLRVQKSIENQSTFEIIASNESGSASDKITIIGIKKALMPEIIIVSPTSNPFNTTKCSGTLIATINNIQSTSQVTLTQNGSKVSTSSYSYASGSKRLTFNYTVSGSSDIVITARNDAGSVNSKVTIKCNTRPPLEEMKKPELAIIYPTTNPYVTSLCKADIKASVKYINSKSDIKILENNVKLSESYYSFNPSNGELKINKNLTKSTSFKLTATNNYGSISKSIVIECQFEKKPYVSITNPIFSPFETRDCVATISANLKEIKSKEQVKVTENGVPISDSYYSYNSSTKTLSIKKSIVGNSVFNITATNSGGSASAQVTIKCIKPPAPPTVNIKYPASSPYTSESCNIEITASITGIESINQISVTENGKSLSSSYYTFNSNNNTFNLKKSINTESAYIITAKNEGGSANDKVVIKCNIPAEKPTVQISNPAANPFTASQANMTVVAKTKNIKTKSQISVSLNSKKLGTDKYNFNASKNEVIVNFILSGNSKLIITVSNESGRASDDLTIVYNVVKTPPVITILVPTQNPYSTTRCIADITARIENIDGLGNIQILENGKNMVSDYYTWNSASQQLTIQQDVESTSNFKIIATNKDGSDTKTVTISCIKP